MIHHSGLLGHRKLIGRARRTLNGHRHNRKVEYPELAVQPRWRRTGNAFFLVAVRVSGQWWVLRLNSFPDNVAKLGESGRIGSHLAKRFLAESGSVSDLRCDDSGRRQTAALV